MSAVIKEVIIGDCRLILGDCMDVMPTLGKVDCVITDPPYGIGIATGTIGAKNSHKRDYGVFDDTHDYLLTVSVPAVTMALKLASGRGVVTPGGAHAFDYPKPSVLGCFWQPASTGMCAWGRVSQQPILFYGRDPRLGKTIQPTGRVLTERPSEARHPCSKPMRAWEWIVERGSLKGESVIDPFMGSGTTGVACVKAGRKFIGIELDPDYFEIACQRIRDAYAQPDMFIETDKPKPPKQEPLL